MWIIVLIAVAVSIFLYIKSANTKISSEDIYSEERLKKMSLSELDALHQEVSYLVALGFDEPANKRLPSNVKSCGCRTYGEARNLMDLTAKVYSNKLPPKKTKHQNFEIITDDEKQVLKKIGKIDVAQKAYNNAIKGDVQSMLFLGLLYFQDVKVPQKSFYWMQKAANRGNPQAEYFLGTYYTDGFGVAQNRTKGIGMIINAASKGNKDAIKACINMGMTEREMRDCGIPI